MHTLDIQLLNILQMRILQFINSKLSYQDLSIIFLLFYLLPVLPPYLLLNLLLWHR